MRTLRLLLAVAFTISATVAIAAPVSAGDKTYLHEPHQKTICPAGTIGVWHLVNNQTKDDFAKGQLRFKYRFGPPRMCPAPNCNFFLVEPTKVNKNVTHYWVKGPRKLVNAWTFNGGRLVLSDYDCLKACD